MCSYSIYCTSTSGPQRGRPLAENAIWECSLDPSGGPPRHATHFTRFPGCVALRLRVLECKCIKPENQHAAQSSSFLSPGLYVIAIHSPRGSEYPNSKVLGPKIHILSGFWTLKPYCLSTWTLRVWFGLEGLSGRESKHQEDRNLCKNNKLWAPLGPNIGLIGIYRGVIGFCRVEGLGWAYRVE